MEKLKRALMNLSTYYMWEGLNERELKYYHDKMVKPVTISVNN